VPERPGPTLPGTGPAAAPQRVFKNLAFGFDSYRVLLTEFVLGLSGLSTWLAVLVEKKLREFRAELPLLGYWSDSS